MDNTTTLKSPPGGDNLYRTGTLVYSKNGLFVLSLWLLWGDFAFTFFESVFGRFLPIFLKDLKASNTLIGVMAGSFSGIVNMLFLPGLSRWSDRLRTRFGRRIPLLYVVTPLTVATVIGVGFGPEIGGWISDRFSAQLPSSLNRGALILWLLSFLVVSFHFFNMLLVNGYHWLIRDVVPLDVMSRFLAWFSIVGTVSGALFSWFVFPHMMDHRKEIFLGVGVFYLIAFSLMCYNVKEGSYPDPEDAEKHVGILKTYAIYFKECLQIPLYRNYFLVHLLVVGSLNCAGSFITLFASSTLSLNMGSMGQIFAWSAVISLMIYYPLGWLCDRFSPLYVALSAIILLVIGSIMALVFVNSARGFLVYSVAFSLPLTIWRFSDRAISMILFPSEKFGQFSGALNVFSCGALIVGNFLIGAVMDLSHSNYRMAFLWTAVICISAIIPILLVIRDWKAFGGKLSYVAPLPKSE